MQWSSAMMKTMLGRRAASADGSACGDAVAVVAAASAIPASVRMLMPES